jgi:phosphoribosylaminoimidazole (AIR) synthetase
VGIDGVVLSQAVEGVFEACREVGKALLEGEKDAHEDLAGFGAGFETRFPGDDRGTQCREE